MPIYKKVNINFFKKLDASNGVCIRIFTADGSMIRNKRGTCFIELEITDKELLEKIKHIYARLINDDMIYLERKKKIFDSSLIKC